MLPSTAIALAAVSAPFAVAATVHKRLIGGQVAKPGEIPFMVSLQINGKHHCGGALLDSTTVLTAAHCLREDDTVRAGSIDRESGGVVVDVASIHQHPDFRLIQHDDGFRSVFDIGVVKLAKRIEKSDTIQFATLATSGSRPEVGSLQTAAGWGMDENRAFSPQLRRVDLPVSDLETCKDKENPEDTDIICAGGGRIGILSGDSGSPLINPASQQVVGVVSRGGNQNIVNPQTFTNVGSYIDFIMQHVEGASEGESSSNEETTGNDQTPPSTADDDSVRIQRDFALIRDIPNLKFAFDRDANLKSELSAKLQAAEDDLLANVGEPDFRLRVERTFAGFTNVPGVKAAMDNDATLAFQLPDKLSEAKQDLLALSGSAFN